MVLHLNAASKVAQAVMIKLPQMPVRMSNHGSVDQLVELLLGNNVAVVKIVTTTILETRPLQVVQLHGLVPIAVVEMIILAAVTTTMAVKITAAVMVVLKATWLHGNNLPHHQMLSQPTVVMVVMRLQATATVTLLNQAWVLLQDLVALLVPWVLHLVSLQFFNNLLVAHLHLLHHLLQLPRHLQATNLHHLLLREIKRICSTNLCCTFIA